MDALVRSEDSAPHRTWWHRSGMRSSRAARGGIPARTWAESWKSVLRERNWMPVRAKISSRGTRANTRSISPRVRSSR